MVIIRHRDGQAYGYFWSRYVLPEHRRKGLARQFLQGSLQWFGSHGAVCAEVHIHVENPLVRSLFESEGFQVVDRRTDRWTSLVLYRELS